MTWRAPVTGLLRSPGPRRSLEEEDGGARPARSFFYERLAQVRVEHAYYAATAGRGPLFTYRPTRYTAALMGRLGLLFRSEAGGFSVLYDTRRSEQLFAYLRRQAVPGSLGPDGEVWTRLSILMVPETPYLVNFTELPMGTNPTRRNVYLTNQRAHREEGRVLLTPGHRVTFADLLRVTPPQFQVTLGDDYAAVEVRGISGETLICKPRCVTAEAERTKRPDQYDCADLSLVPCGNQRVFVDLSLLPEDRYTVVKVPYPAAAGDGAGDGARPAVEADSRDLLYTSGYPVPFGFVDLLFTRPCDPEGAGETRPCDGVFPVSALFQPKETRIDPVSYLVRFGARQTTWVYRVNERHGQVFDDLEIRDPRGEVRFLGPCCLETPAGRSFLFASAERLELLQQSAHRFELLGRTVASSYPEVLLAPVPLPSPEQVLPEAVRGSAGGLAALLCPGGTAAGSAACEELMEHLRSVQGSFSEVFVYV